MDEKELKTRIEAADKAYKELKDSVSKKADAATIEGLKADFNGMVEKATMIGDKKLTDYIKALQDHADTLEGQIKEIVSRAQKTRKDPGVELDEFLTGKEFTEAVKAFRGGASYQKIQSLGLQKVLTVGSDLTAGTTSPVILPDREPGVIALPRADTPLFNLVQKGVTTKDKVSWVERTIAAESQSTAMTAENNAFGESDASWTEVEASVKKITDSFKCTNEMLEDTEFVRSEIMAMLTTNIPHLRETQILSGANSSTEMNGLVTGATAFSLPTGVNPVSEANEIDGLRAAILQCKLGYNASNKYTKGFVPNAIVLNPVDAHNIGGMKDSEGRWLLPGWFQGVKFIDGIPVIESTDMTVGSYLVGALNNVKYYIRRGLVVRFWDQYDTDPAYDRVLFTATERGCLAISNIAAYGLITGTIVAATAAVSS